METKKVDAVDIGPITLADAMRARDVLAAAGEACAPLAAMLALRIAQYERAELVAMVAELDALADTFAGPFVPDGPRNAHGSESAESVARRRSAMGRWI